MLAALCSLCWWHFADVGISSYIAVHVGHIVCCEYVRKHVRNLCAWLLCLNGKRLLDRCYWVMGQEYQVFRHCASGSCISLHVDCAYIKRKFYASCNSIIAKCKNADEFVELSLVKSMCLPVCNHPSLWSYDLTELYKSVNYYYYYYYYYYYTSVGVPEVGDKN